MEIDRSVIEDIIKKVLSEQQKESSVLKFCPLTEEITEADRLDTGVSHHRVYTKDLTTLTQSPRLGIGVMEMEKTTFPWHLDYDEADIVLEGSLSIIQNGITKTAKKGEILFIPKGSDIEFSVPDYSRFVYVTYPADWQNTN